MVVLVQSAQTNMLFYNEFTSAVDEAAKDMCIVFINRILRG
jgi:hypothetical protein